MSQEANERVMTEVTASDPQTGTEATVEVDLGADLTDAINKFGEELVYDYWARQAVVQAQAAIRNRLRAGKSVEEVVAEMQQWEPGKMRRSSGAGKNTLDKTLGAFEKMNEEQQREFLQKLREKMQPE